jgi:hypothetical protein
MSHRIFCDILRVCGHCTERIVGRGGLGIPIRRLPYENVVQVPKVHSILHMSVSREALPYGCSQWASFFNRYPSCQPYAGLLPLRPPAVNAMLVYGHLQHSHSEVVKEHVLQTHDSRGNLAGDVLDRVGAST